MNPNTATCHLPAHANDATQDADSMAALAFLFFPSMHAARLACGVWERWNRTCILHGWHHATTWERKLPCPFSA